MILTKKRSELPKRIYNYHPFLEVSPNSWRIWVAWLHQSGVTKEKCNLSQGQHDFGQHYPMPHGENFNYCFIMIHYDSLSLQLKDLFSQKGPHNLIPRNPTFFTPFCGSFPIHIPQWTRRIFARPHLFQSQSTWVVTQEILGSVWRDCREEVKLYICMYTIP